MSLTPSSTGPDLTPREIEVASLIAEGLLHKQVALRLGISEETVRVHVYNAASKIPGSGLPTRKLIMNGHLFPASDSV